MEVPAASVCYVFEFEGELPNGFAQLVSEINTSIGGLDREQRFNIVFIPRPERPFATTSLAPATLEEKARAGRFLDDLAWGGVSDPVPALQVAMDQKPQVVFLVSNGEFPDDKAVLEWLALHNWDKAVEIYTVAYVREPNGQDGLIDLFRMIASESGGQFRMVQDPGEPN